MVIFERLTYDELAVLHAHLSSGWAKQAIVYRCTPDGANADGGLYGETLGTLSDTIDAMFAASRAVDA